MEIKVKQKMSFSEARKLQAARTPAAPAGKTYAGVLATSRVQTGQVTKAHAETQTEITWPVDQEQYSKLKTVPQTQPSQKSIATQKSAPLEHPGKEAHRSRSRPGTSKTQMPRKTSASPGSSEKRSEKPKPKPVKKQRGDHKMVSNKFEAISDLSEEEQMELTSTSPPRSPHRGK